MQQLSLWAMILTLTSAFSAASASPRNCAKIYNDCRSALFSDKKACQKKRSKCEDKNEQDEVATTQATTKNRMLSGESSSQNSMRPGGGADSMEARKEAARRRIRNLEADKAQAWPAEAPQNSNMRDSVHSN